MYLTVMYAAHCAFWSRHRDKIKAAHGSVDDAVATLATLGRRLTSDTAKVYVYDDSEFPKGASFGIEGARCIDSGRIVDPIETIRVPLNSKGKRAVR